MAVHSESNTGRIHLCSDGSSVAFAELSATYPLKLLSPRIPHPGVAVVYVLSYGGGLVAGDFIQLAIEVEKQSILVALTQGSTKVFKMRPGKRASSRRFISTGSGVPSTTQIMNVAVHDDGAFFLLPDPVCCFRSASYHQIQTFRLSPKASLIILDWFNSGRKSLGEDWSFARYYSTNEIWVNDNRIAKDVMLLENDADNTPSLGRRPLAVRLAPYTCYATILFHGPLLKGIVEDLGQQFSSLSVFKRHAPDDLLWSFSPTSEGGAIVRVAGKDTESVKDWLKKTLSGLEDIVGVDVFRRTFV